MDSLFKAWGTTEADGAWMHDLSSTGETRLNDDTDSTLFGIANNNVTGNYL